jgi:hypothetical protein
MVPAKKLRSIKRPRLYEALRRRGMPKKTAARIANASRSRHRKRK